MKLLVGILITQTQKIDNFKYQVASDKDTCNQNGIHWTFSHILKL